MKKADDGIIYANTVPAVGYFNGVVNVTLAAFQFTPTDDGKIDPDPAITGRLRMDEACAVALRDSINNILSAMADARVKAAVDTHAAQDPANGADRKETMQ
jgi:hypothetical protein